MVNLAYNGTEVVVTLIAGFLTGSSALIAFGLDSAIEAIAASTLIWWLYGEEQGASDVVVGRPRRRPADRSVCALAGLGRHS